MVGCEFYFVLLAHVVKQMHCTPKVPKLSITKRRQWPGDNNLNTAGGEFHHKHPGQIQNYDLLVLN